MEKGRFNLDFPFPAVCVRGDDVKTENHEGEETVLSLKSGEIYTVCGVGWHDFQQSYSVRILEMDGGNFGFFPDRFVPELTVRYNLLVHTGLKNISDIRDNVIKGASKKRY